VKFQSKADLLEAIEREHRAFVDLVESQPPRSRSHAAVWGDGWTIKDLCAHLTEWEQMFLGWYRAGREGRAPAVPAEGYKWNETPRLNKAIWRKHRDKPWRSVREEFDSSYEEILRLAKQLEESELLTPGFFPWTKKLPLMTYLAANTSSHYRTGTKILKRWLRAKDE
jgi:hypothetical protein